VQRSKKQPKMAFQKPPARVAGNFSDHELSVMRRLAGRGRLYTPETEEEEQTLSVLRMKGIATNDGLTRDGWKVLKDADDDPLSD
jgi:hypothetical protein